MGCAVLRDPWRGMFKHVCTYVTARVPHVFLGDALHAAQRWSIQIGITLLPQQRLRGRIVLQKEPLSHELIVYLPVATAECVLLARRLDGFAGLCEIFDPPLHL